jgi:type IV pilus assembly protein PilV
MGGPRQAKGFSLIEVVIAIAVFSTGLGGLSLLLMLAIQETAASHWQAAAASRAQSAIEWIRTVPSRPLPTPAAGYGPCLHGDVCPPEAMASAAISHWQQDVATLLPGGAGILCLDATPDDGNASEPACDGAGERVAKVFWTEPATGGRPGPEARRIVTVLPLP